MPLLKAIKIYNGRIAQLKTPVGNNQQGRASDINPIIDWVNERSDVNTSVNTVTSSGGSQTAQTGTLNAISGTITSATLASNLGQKTTITITNSFCFANSTVLAVITSAPVGTGAVIVQGTVASNGSFQITLTNVLLLTGTPAVTIKFIIL